ncbi:MAG: hypothetical protein U0525_01230 [Patescibacteria group bacterium]
MKFKIHSSKSKKLVIVDPLAPNGSRAGQYFISFPSDLSQKLPGSVMLPKEFLNKYGIKEVSESDLLSDHISSKDTPLITINKGSCAISIFHGSFNEHALTLGAIASKGFENANVRAEYQKNIFEIMSPIFDYGKTKKTKVDYWIVEDCLASGDTLIGVMSLLTTKHQVKTVRIDVAVATTIGVDLILETAASLGIALILNIGFLAYGLSKGEKQGHARLHANYITYPIQIKEKLKKSTKQKIEQLVAPDGNIYVVGDMGDGAKSMDNTFDMKYPWNL